MAGRGPQSFKKRQKEQARKEKQQEKLAKRMERRQAGPGDPNGVEDLDDIGFGPLEPGEAEAAAERSLMNRDRPLTTLER